MNSQVNIICSETDILLLEDVATFLKDLVYLHDRLALLAPYNIENFKQFENIYFLDYFYRRFSRPLPESDKLKVSHIHLGSPLSIELLIGIIFGFPTAALAFIKLLQIIRDWDLDREKKRLENLELKLRIHKLINEMAHDLGLSNLQQLDREEVIKLIEKDTLRLTRHEIKIVEVNFKQGGRNDRFD